MFAMEPEQEEQVEAYIQQFREWSHEHGILLASDLGIEAGLDECYIRVMVITELILHKNPDMTSESAVSDVKSITDGIGGVIGSGVHWRQMLESTKFIDIIQEGVLHEMNQPTCYGVVFEDRLREFSFPKPPPEPGFLVFWTACLKSEGGNVHWLVS